MVLGQYFSGALAAARKGSVWAWVSIYRDLHGPLHAYVRGSSVDSSDDDLLPETFLRMAREIHRFEGDEDDFRAWAFEITRHAVEAEWRASGSAHAATDSVHASDLAARHCLTSDGRLPLGDLSLVELRAVIRGLSMERCPLP
ncbi:sigma factor [Demequina sp. SO4-18]|uniref:sigma factor n=1 Tax=Demequina sp. SO4-18 TaxID=3401026 RepID=UPI003B5BDE80